MTALRRRLPFRPRHRRPRYPRPRHRRPSWAADRRNRSAPIARLRVRQEFQYRLERISLAIGAEHETYVCFVAQSNPPSAPPQQNFCRFHESQTGEDLAGIEEIDGDRCFRHQRSPPRAERPAFALIVVARGLLVGGAQKRFPPGKTPWPPTLLQPSEAQRDGAGALFERGGRRIFAATRSDHRPRLP